ncbi:MAG: response regulator transcription factor [Mariprofundaceae bacterium]
MSAMRILLIDDDVELCQLLAEFLAGEGFLVEYTHDGKTGLAKATGCGFDAIVLDVMLPEINGMDVLRQIRQASDTPVIMLTARGEEMDRIIGLEIGADDYLPKPCNPRELVARIRAVLRRTSKRTLSEIADDVIKIDAVECRLKSREVLERGQPVTLTAREFDILAVLMKSAGEVVSKASLSEQGLGKRLGPYDRSLDVHIGHIRKKLAPLADDASRIRTVRSMGYMFVRDA